MIHIIPSKTELKLKQLKRFGRSLPFPYQALQSFMKFKVHARDIAFDAESLADLHRLEVRVVRAVAAAGRVMAWARQVFFLLKCLAVCNNHYTFA